MTERTANILEAVIHEFIEKGEPVSSGFLYDHYEFGIKPAMIRLELDELEEQGYLEQPHHSAGRVPTNRGYEFFGERMLGARGSSMSGMSGASRVPGVAAAQKNTLHDLFAERAWPDLLNELSAQLGVLSVAADMAREAVYKTGLEQLIDQLDWRDQNGIRSVIHDFHDVDERVASAGEKVGAGPKIFVGKKSPVTKSESLSVVGGNYIVGDATIAIFVIGPKRMDYRKVIHLFRSL